MAARKVVIVTSGSRGDVQPYVLLGLEIQSRGYEVVIATEARMQELVQQLGDGRLGYYCISGDPTGMLYEQRYQVLLAKGSILPVMRATEQHNKPFLTKVLSDTAAACQGADLILSGPLSLTATMCVAEQLRVPWVPVVLGPVMPTAEFPSWAISNSPFTFKCLNRATYSFIFWALWKQESARINCWRRDSLRLPPLQQGSAGVLAACLSIPVITMCSRHVIPGLQAPRDWGSNVHLTGFAFPAATPPDAVDPKLRAFLQPDGGAAAGGDAAGSTAVSTAVSSGKPLYLGFGSMPAPDPKALLQLAVQVVQQTGKRAVLVAGWSELGGLIGNGEGQVQLPEGLLVVPSAPHDWLLPRCCLAVHHCGVGTCGAVLRAGIPSVPCPVMLDQPFLAARLVEAGVACAPLPFHKVNAQALVQRIQQVLGDGGLQERAAAVAAEVEAYPGVARAADIALGAVSPWEKD